MMMHVIWVWNNIVQFKFVWETEIKYWNESVLDLVQNEDDDD